MTAESEFCPPRSPRRFRLCLEESSDSLSLLLRRPGELGRGWSSRPAMSATFFLSPSSCSVWLGSEVSWARPSARASRSSLTCGRVVGTQSLQCDVAQLGHTEAITDYTLKELPLQSREKERTNQLHATSPFLSLFAQPLF